MADERTYNGLIKIYLQEDKMDEDQKTLLSYFRKWDEFKENILKNRKGLIDCYIGYLRMIPNAYIQKYKSLFESSFGEGNYELDYVPFLNIEKAEAQNYVLAQPEGTPDHTGVWLALTLKGSQFTDAHLENILAIYTNVLDDFSYNKLKMDAVGNVISNDYICYKYYAYDFEKKGIYDTISRKYGEYDILDKIDYLKEFERLDNMLNNEPKFKQVFKNRYKDMFKWVNQIEQNNSSNAVPVISSSVIEKQ